MIGLYVQQDTIRGIDLIKKRQGYVVNAIAEEKVHLPMPEYLRTLDNNDEYDYFISNFTSAVTKLLSAKGFKSNEMAVAVDIRNVFIHTIPFDGDFTPDNLAQLIEWELTHYFPIIPSNAFLFDTYNPGFNPAKDICPKFIYTAVLRSYIHLIQRGIKESGKKLVSINVDQFTLENLLKLSAKENKRERLNAVCFRYDHLLFCSLLWNHRLVSYREYTIDEKNPPDKRIGMFLKPLNGPRKNIEQRIYYYPFDENIIESTEKNTGWIFERFRVFDDLKLTRKARKNLPQSVQAQEGYAPAISVALKST
jgi:hypothetical protein